MYAYGKDINMGRRGGINRSNGKDELARGIMGYRAMQGEGGYQNRTDGQRINPRLTGGVILTKESDKGK